MKKNYGLCEEIIDLDNIINDNDDIYYENSSISCESIIGKNNKDILK